MVHLAVDCMGADLGPLTLIDACLSKLLSEQELVLSLVGDEATIRSYLSKHNYPKDRLHVLHSSDVIEMNDTISCALRQKKDSSMRVALHLLGKNQVDGVVSSGNTGALMALARYVIKMLPGVDRPAIIAALPALRSHTYVLDLGANVDVDSETLYQFGIMGSVVSRLMSGIESPRVGLLNIGTEEIKGNDQVKQAAQLLKDCDHLNYSGFVEGHQIFNGDVDVVVCDGFVGNVALKACEGVSSLAFTTMVESMSKTWLTRLIAKIFQSHFNKVHQKMNPDLRNGASLVGINGVVVKSHGSANKEAFESAISTAIDAVRHRLPERIRSEIENIQINRSLF